MRVLLAVHHHLDPDLGAPGATLQLGAALTRAGCEVDVYGFDQAFPRRKTYGVWSSVEFPWRLTSHLVRRARRYDVLDVTTGDGWIWAAAGRWSARPGHVLVTRSHGLEHPAADRRWDDARAGRLSLSWKFPLYHGGYRLWEVRQSLLLADQVLLLNEADRAYAIERLGVDADSVAVVPNGVAPHFHDLPARSPERQGVLRLAFIGSWLEHKGIATLRDALSQIQAAGVNFEVQLLGTRLSGAQVLGDIPNSILSRVRVVPEYRNRELPALLARTDILLVPSPSEGFGLGLVEAMACGVAPVTTPVGIAPAIIDDARNGLLIPVADARAMADAVTNLADAPDRLSAMQRAAQVTAGQFSWDAIARRTLGLYEAAALRRASRPRSVPGRPVAQQAQTFPQAVSARNRTKVGRSG